MTAMLLAWHGATDEKRTVPAAIQGHLVTAVLASGLASERRLTDGLPDRLSGREGILMTIDSHGRWLAPGVQSDKQGMMPN
jgi:hypothetical protein